MTWSVGTLGKNGGTATLVVTTTVTKTGDVTNKACVTTTSAQVDSSVKCDEDTVKGTAADVTITNRGSAVNWATRERFPHIIEGDYLEGGLTNTLMMKDVTLYADYVGALGVFQARANTCVALAAKGLRNLDSGNEAIADTAEAAALKNQAIGVVARAAIVAMVLTAPQSDGRG